MARRPDGSQLSRPAPRITIYKIQTRADRSTPYYVRWTVNGKERGPRTFKTRSQADRFRSRLVTAAEDGLKWDLLTGEPVSWSIEPDVKLAAYCRQFVERKSDDWSPRMTFSVSETFANLCLASVAEIMPPTPGILSTLIEWIAGGPECPEVLWLNQCSPIVSSLDKPRLDKIAKIMKQGTSANVRRRRFSEVRRLLDDAVRLGFLENNELERLTKNELAKCARKIDKRYPSLTTMLEVARATPAKSTASRLFRTASMVGILAGCRPSETMALEWRHVKLPETGWGELTIDQAVKWEATSELGDVKALNSERDVPIPPQLVIELREWRNIAGGAGFVFRTRNDTVPSIRNWNRALRRATISLGVRQMSSYDLRRFHGTWLAECGVPYNEAARRMGHSLEIFMKHYVGTTVEVAEVSNAAIERALR